MSPMRSAAAVASIAALSLGLTSCGEGGALGELSRMGQSDYEPITSESSTDQEGPDVVEAVFNRVIDGDTVSVKTGDHLPANNASGSEHSVRVLGIDAPEIDWNDGDHECGAQAAGDRLREVLENGDTVKLVYDAHADRYDRFDRSLAYVETDEGLDVAALLAEEGLVNAWYPSGEPEPERYELYAGYVDAAQTSSIGSWAHCDSMGR